MQSHPYCSTYAIENYFSLLIQQNISSARIKMLLLKDPINTADIPSTHNILQNFLPSVLTTQCFNDQNLPFSLEVKRTEIGHLFEHILLEYMCQLKIGKGHKSASYTGRTRWNWERDPRGVFHIHINCTLKDADIFPLALNKSITLMKKILHHNQFPSSRNSLPIRSNEGLKNGKKLRKK
jgi:hypothetical protein